MKILYDVNCLKDTDERLFPASRHRSRRVHKKLLKRHGGEFRKQPVMFIADETIYAHPYFKASLDRVTRAAEPFITVQHKIT